MQVQVISRPSLGQVQEANAVPPVSGQSRCRDLVACLWLPRGWRKERWGEARGGSVLQLLHPPAQRG